MEEIKIRAWCRCYSNMIFSEMVYGKRNFGIDFYCDATVYEEYCEGIPKHTLMLSTGLKDKNGVEIYEGDIVVIHISHKLLGADFGSHRALVKWRDKGGCFEITEVEYLPDGVGYVFDNGCVNSVEIIGNRFENPELLEEK